MFCSQGPGRKSRVTCTQLSVYEEWSFNESSTHVQRRGPRWSNVSKQVKLRWMISLTGNSVSMCCELELVRSQKQLTQCRNISEWRRCFILLVWLWRKGIILSVSLNRCNGYEMSNQLKSHPWVRCDDTAPPPGENRPEAFSVNSLL